MSKIKVQVISKGLVELMNSEEIQDTLQNEADKVVSRCKGNYDTDVYTRNGWTRSIASIVTRDKKTFFKNLRDNELLKALWQ